MKGKPFWKEVALLDICDLNPIQPAMSAKANVDYLDFSNIDDLSGEIASTRERPLVEIPRASSLFREGDVLFAGITADNWVSALVGALPNGVGASSRLTVLRPTPELSARFLWHFLQQPWVRHKAAAMNPSTHSQPTTSLSFLQSFRIALPSLDEQRHIVNCLDQASVRPYQNAQQRVFDLKAALAERLMLPKRHSSVDEWTFISLEDICRVDPVDEQSRIDANEVVQFLSQRNLLPAQSTPLDVLYRDMPNPAREVNAGDLLYGDEPETDTYGCVLQVPPGNRRKFASRTTTVVRPDKGVFAPYLAALLQSHWFNYPHARYGVSALRGTNIPSRLRRRKIPLPSLARQKHIVTLLNAIPDQAIKAALVKSRAIYHAMAREAFVGRFSAPRAAQPQGIPAGVSSKAYAAPSTPAHSRASRAVAFRRGRHRSVISSLSILQRLVWRTMRRQAQVLIVDDPQAFDAFCVSPLLVVLRDKVSANQIRRTLEQIAALGLIQKMNVPPNSKSELATYLTAFRGYPEHESGKPSEDTADADTHALYAQIRDLEREA